MAFKIAVVISLTLALCMAQTPPVQATIGSLLTLVQVTLNDLRNTSTGLPIANTTSPILSGALVQVRLGTTSLGLALTDRTGSANITLSPPLLLTSATTLVNNLVNTGTIRILNPVLNQTAGLLTSTLQVIGSVTSGLFTIIRLGPSPGGFTLVIN